MELVGPPRFTDEASDFARKIQSNLRLAPMEKPFLDDNERLMPPQEYEARLRRAMPEWQTNYTSDDYVDYTWHAPTVRLLTMRPRLRPPTPAARKLPRSAPPPLRAGPRRRRRM